MSTIFDFTYNLNTLEAQSAILASVAAAKKKEYEPTSHFFSDQTLLSAIVASNYGTDAFGPVTGSETTKYRTTSIVRTASTNPVKLFAICDGQLLIQPQTGDNTKVNLILKPTTSYSPLKIKYFIYRGVNKSDLIDANILKPVDNEDSNQPFFLRKLWEKFIAFNQPFYDQGIISTPPDTFPAFLIGYGESDDPKITIEYYFTRKINDNFFQIPTCSMGDHLGNFTGQIGLDIVLDHGDYGLVNQEELFKLDLAFARLKENVLDTSTILSSTATKIKRYKENIHQFIDPAAFWGSHIESGNVKLFDNPTGIKTNNDIYTLLVSKYQTRNKLYLYIQGEKNRSYNYFEATRKVYGFDPAGKLNQVNGWPITIEEITLTTATTTFKEGKNIQLEFSIDTSINELDRHVSIDIIAPNNNTSKYPLLSRPKNPAVVPAILIDKTPAVTLLFPVNGLKSCSSFTFIYANLKQEFPIKDYFNELWPVNIISNFYLPSGEINLTSWCTYDKSRMVNLDEVNSFGASIQNKVVFDNGITQALVGPNLPTKKRRLYIAALKRNTNHDTESDSLNIDTITSGLAVKTSSIEDYALNLYNDKDFVPYKGTFSDGADTINSITLFHNNSLTKKNSYFHLGITDEEYNKLVYDNVAVPIVVPPALPPQILPIDADNVFFNLEEELTFATQNVKKYKLGLRYEDSSGVISTVFPTSPANDVFVYTLDGLYFFSKEYSLFHQFSESYPKAKVNFRVKLPYAGDFGFDWMRIADTGAPGDFDYKNHVGKLYSDAAHTNVELNSNTYTGHFLKLDKLFNKLKLHYKPYPMQFTGSNVVDKYYVPILSLYPPYVVPPSPSPDLDRQNIFIAPYNDDMNRLAKLTLKIEVSEEPVKMELDFDNTKFSITPTILPKTVGSHSVDVEVKSLSDFGTEQLIRVKAYYSNSGVLNSVGKTIGVLRVKPNSKAHRGSKKVLFVLVKTNINGTVKVPSGNSKALFMKKFLRQLFITPIIEVLEMDMTSDTTFNSSYVHTTSGGIKKILAYNLQTPLTPFGNVSDYLYNLISTVYNIPGTTTPIGAKYDSYYRMFFFEEDGCRFNSSGVYADLNGSQSGNNIVGFITANDATASHEFLHSTKLPHSFAAFEASKYAKFTYEPYKTDNIMDYSHHVSIDRLSLWDWQSEVAEKDPEP
ncbi:MAG: hypothetical protein J0L86_05605 [Flavobacteriales bacterium]|nr:hypothetical protein [Flavobacteriales bacterium]